MGAFENAQRKNIDAGEKSGRISKATADAARAKLNSSSSSSSSSSSTPKTSSSTAAQKSSSSSSSGSSSSGSSSGSNIKKTSGGYAYTDKYGFSHVVSDPNTAKQYAAPNTSVYNYTGQYGGGYATNPTGGRVALNLPSAKNYGNLDTSKGDTSLENSTDYSKYIGPILRNMVGTTGQTQATSATPTTSTYQQALSNYKANPSAGYAEIERAGQVYTQKMAAGDVAGANAAHTWANQIRDAMGVSSQYDRTTGASLGTAQTAQSTPTAQGITTQQYQETPQQYGMTQESPGTPGAQQYSVPYESLLMDLMNKPSSYKAPTESELLTQAQQYAELQTSPLISAIQSRLAKERTSQEAARSATEAAYAGVPARTQSLLDDARRNALESAISRGMGRSGVVDWQTEKLSSPIMQQATESEQEKAAKLSAIANALATAESEAERQRQEAISQRGTLEASRLADLRQQAQQLAAQEQAAKWGQGFNLAQLAQQSNTSAIENAIRLALLNLGGV